MAEINEPPWEYISFDKNGVWTARAPAGDPMAGQINLNADWPEGIPLVRGSRIGSFIADQTRYYSVEEITRRLIE